MPEQIPSQIGRYRIVSVLRHVETLAPLLPSGKLTATLYRGRDEFINLDVTIKVLSLPVANQGEGPDLARELIELRQRFYREGKITAGLSHPNIISVLDLGEDEGISYIVFEALKGRTLQEAIEAGISPKAGLPIILQVLDGLAYMHSNGVIHRDIRPDNIMVGSAGLVKIMNFGIARVVDSTLTKTGSLMGTPPYMSPEQASGHAVDGRSDLFSLGIVLYEVIAGKKPFRGDTYPALLLQILKDNPDMSLIPGAPEWERLRGVITRALQKKPENRYPDALAMRADLKLALNELRIAVPRLSLDLWRSQMVVQGAERLAEESRHEWYQLNRALSLPSDSYAEAEARQFSAAHPDQSDALRRRMKLAQLLEWLGGIGGPSLRGPATIAWCQECGAPGVLSIGKCGDCGTPLP